VHVVEFKAEVHEYLRCHTLLLAQSAEKEMLRADVWVIDLCASSMHTR